MIVEILAIGEEILRGAIVNTNAAFISQEMQTHGWKVSRQTVLSDDPVLLKAGLQEALERADIIITTGGLGPTCDDLTRAVVAELFDSPFHYDQKIADDLKRRFGAELPSLRDQATIPSKAEPLMNRVGTAPGLVFRKGKKCLIMMPGVPQEMTEMFTHQAIPYLEKHFQPQGIYHQIFHLCRLAESQVDPLLRKLQERCPEVEFGIYPFWGLLTISLASHDRSQLGTAAGAILTDYGHLVYSTQPHEKIEEVLRALFVQKKKTLACAESCTGGMIAERLTSVPGASDYFLGSFVTYSNALKQNILGVSATTLKDHGAVSRETVLEMLAGVFAQTTADFAISVTGIAGPTGGTPEKPVGTVWMAIGERGQTPHVELMQIFRSNRQAITISSTHHVLGALWQKIISSYSQG